jgi:predicted O-linked N-acetylglucosamine transferase (SPINDLY family)
MTELQNKISMRIIKKNKNDKIKIAIVGEHIRNHSVWNVITKGIITNIDNKLFELHIYHLGNIFDEETALAIKIAKKYNNGFRSAEQWANKLVDDEIQVIIYPEIGMHKLTTQLATLRLAKLQLAFWGHPETTGFSTIDYFVSSELIEPHNYLKNYTEKVLLLPDLGCYFTPPNIITKKITKSSLGIKEDVSILLCPGVSFKYDTVFDEILVQIAKNNLNVCFMFFESNEYKSQYLKKRLFKKFNENQLSSEQIIFRPWPNLEELYEIMSISTLCLDTIVHSGFNTAISCLECLLPQITYEGDFFRNRQAADIMKNIDVLDTIVNSVDEYIEKVNSLIDDKFHLNSIQEKIKNNKNALYNNLNPIRYLEKFIFDNLNEK